MFLGKVRWAGGLLQSLPQTPSPNPHKIVLKSDLFFLPFLRYSNRQI